jgi:hypothetical protein
MKTNVKVMGALAALFILITAFINVPKVSPGGTPEVKQAKAPQCPHVNNMLNCPVTISVTVYVNPNCANICATYTTVVNPGMNTLTCNGCGYCNVEVTVLDLGGIPLATPVTVDFVTTTGLLPNMPPCNANNITYNASMLTFDIM